MQVSDGTIYDDENVAIAVFNNANLTTDYKQSYISALRTTITSIKEIADSSLWSSLLDADIVQYSEYNIMDSFNAVELNESVIGYINRCDIDLDFQKRNMMKMPKKNYSIVWLYAMVSTTQSTGKYWCH